ncbi:nucleic acid-binding, OB-fold protein [Artemisia annua]|uniref:Nucleic acid-binding, OB-fold protein n=1 Tax=Artemisia annua TaxID=35608 RepID=A0A2U1N374_ARTAN|nr:nucleic acid-binding, OB-fold protein [Artemisia annua]
MEVSEKKQFTTYLILGRTYRISGFTCAPTRNWQQTLENRTSLSFTRFTKFDTIPPTGFPNHYFRFISYNRLHRLLHQLRRKRRMGKPKQKSDVAPQNRNPKSQRLPYNNVHSRKSVELTLWDDLAESFPKEKIDALEKPVIIAVSSCRVARFRNNLQLSSTPATYYYINPAIPELPYKAEMFGLLAKEQSQVLTHHENGTTLHVQRAQTKYKYNFKAYVTDTTGTITMTFFSPKADDIVGISCQTLVDSLENPDPREFPERILAVIGKQHIFQFHYNTNSRQGPVTFILYQILDKPQTESQITDKASGSGTIQESSKTIETNVPEEQQTTTAIEYTPPTTLPPRPTQLASPLPQVSLAQTESATYVMPTSQPAEAPESPEENPLQQEDISGEEVPPLSPTYTYMQTRSRHGKQVVHHQHDKKDSVNHQQRYPSQKPQNLHQPNDNFFKKKQERGRRIKKNDLNNKKATTFAGHAFVYHALLNR